MDTSIPREVLRADAPSLFVGFLVLIIGLVACLFFFLRAKRKDVSVLYFGIAAAMYGFRLIGSTATIRLAGPLPANFWRVTNWVVTGTIVIPFLLFIVLTVAPQWKKAGVWISAFLGVMGIVEISGHALGLHNWAGLASSVTVLLFLPLLLLVVFFPKRPVNRELWIVRAGLLVFMGFVLYTNLAYLVARGGHGSVEMLGFLIFICCLGYVAASRSVHNEEKLLAIQKELEIARRIQSSLLPNHDANIPGLEIASKYVPVSSVAGDFYDFLKRDRPGLGVLVADVSGHGIPAALSASMVKIAIRAQSAHADDPAAVLSGLNSILYGNMQGQFVTAGYVFIDLEKQELLYAGAGHPPLLVWRAGEKRVQPMEENGLFLGAFPGCQYTALRSTLSPGDRCVLYTDGILEAPNSGSEEFGAERLSDFVKRNSSLSPKEFCNALMRRLTDWSGGSGSSGQHDDMTIVVIDFKTAPSGMA